MAARRFIILAAAILLGIAALFFLRRGGVGAVAPNRPGSAAAPVPGSSLVPAAENPKSKTSESTAESGGVSHIADELNAPAGTIRRDLEILNEVFVTWQTNFPRNGNPVGDNAEITAALCGDNPVRFAFISRPHRAITTRGELVDRWGTPFRFHSLSGTQMEIRSAGPDQKFGTPDDVEFSPSSLIPVPR